MKAVVLGSTGLVGEELLKLLVKNSYFEEILLINRRKGRIISEKVSEQIVDFKDLSNLNFSQIDVLFIAFGTTLKTAGSKENQWKIDVEIPSKVMGIAREQGVENCVLISSLGVSKKSLFFYSRMKAQLDENAKNCGFKKLVIVKPSVLDGDRKEKRAGEKLSIQLGNWLGATGLINVYRPVKAINVAATMIQGFNESTEEYTEIVSKDIPTIAERYFKK